MTSYIKSDNHIHIVFTDGKSATIYNSQPNYNNIITAIKQCDWNEAYTLAFPAIKFTDHIRASTKHITSRVTVEHGLVILDGTPVHNTLVTRMLNMIDEGFDVTALAKFLENLMRNSSYTAINELYDFLEYSKLPITEDGHFLAYKKVRHDFLDIYSGTKDNSPGINVSMPRNEVNENKHQTCSHGLHFCSYEYLNKYGSDNNNKVIMVKINPADVVAIPSDYNNTKGRCCKYLVVCEIEQDKNNDKYIPALNDTTVLNVTPGQVKQIDPKNNKTLMTHRSLQLAATATGINAEYIKRVCNKGRKTTGGFIWEWVTF